MNLFIRSVKVNLAILILFGLVLLATFCSIYVFSVKDQRWQSIISGLATGFVLAIIQFLFSWYEFAKISRYEKMRIKDIRHDRDDRKMYEGLISKSKKEIIVLGVTASRLVNDFADETSNREDSKVLIRALEKGVSVKILVPNHDYLIKEKDKQIFSSVQKSFVELSGRFTHFQYKYFEHAPTHSIFLVDDDCIVGPVFPGVSSKNTPSIHVEKTSPFSNSYLKYFQSEWDAC